MSMQTKKSVIDVNGKICVICSNSDTLWSQKPKIELLTPNRPPLDNR